MILFLGTVNLKTLYVDLSKSRLDPFVESEFNNQESNYTSEVNNYFMYNRIKRRDSDTFSEGNTLHYNNSNSFIDISKLIYFMDRRRPCNQQQYIRDSWKKYCYALCKWKNIRGRCTIPMLIFCVFQYLID